ncbi:MAG: hypothetical protein ACO1SV_16520 [Fimbriimonas sp.]
MLALLLLAPRVIPIPFSEAITSAKRIVVGQVAEVRSEYGIKVALLDVAETLKGEPVRRIRFIAEGSWACDVSGAKVGERGLFLLAAPRVMSKTLMKPAEFEAATSQTDPPYPLHAAGSGRLVFEPQGLAAYHFGDAKLRYGHYLLGPVFKVQGTQRKREYPDPIYIPEQSILRFVEKTLKSPPKSKAAPSSAPKSPYLEQNPT